MASIDERIKAELEQGDNALGALLANDNDDMQSMVMQAFSGGIKRWLWPMAVITLALFIALVFLLVKFTGAATVTDQILWGVWAILSGITVVCFELWAWMQINRISTRHEIKLLELAVRKLAEKS